MRLQKKELKRAEIIDAWPKRLELNGLEKMLLFASVIIVLLAFLRLMVLYPSLPEIIPSHFNVRGEVDAYDNKHFLLIVMGLDVVVWMSLAVANFFPQMINVPVFLLKRPAEEIIRGSRVFLNLTAILCAGLFWYLVESTAHIALGNGAVMLGYGVWVFLAVLLILTIAYFVWLAIG